VSAPPSRSPGVASVGSASSSAARERTIHPCRIRARARASATAGTTRTSAGSASAVAAPCPSAPGRFRSAQPGERPLHGGGVEGVFGRHGGETGLGGP
jgi:hypothetical protein